MKKFSTLCLGIALGIMSFAQTTNTGAPLSFNEKLLSDGVNVLEVVMPEFDLEKQLEDDYINRVNKVGPYRFGYEHITNYNIQSSGTWDNTDDGGRIWRIKFSSPGALSMNVVFDDFYLPEGATIHLYNKETNMVEGAYTSFNNNKNNMLGSDLIKGESITIEYYEPSEVTGQGRLLIGMVVHGYVDVNHWYPKTMKVNESGACNKDVVCWDACDWVDEIRSVARILSGGGYCSGALINNTEEDGTPYFLTANHCSPSNMGSGVFRFNYNSTVCASQSTSSSVASTFNTINGSTFLAKNAASDFGLLELNVTPPADYEVYYAGWDNTGSTPQSGVGIHHPAGDVKKISFDDDPLSSASGCSISNSEWRIGSWDRNTTTEPGSSGSPLFDSNHHIVGQLHCGSANCGNSMSDYYGKFSMSWTGNGSSSSSARLKDWLDPNNTGVTSLGGYDPNGEYATPEFCLTGLLEKESSNIFFEMFPNPAYNIVTINLNQQLEEVSVELLDIQGRLVKAYNNVSGTSIEIKLDAVSAGVYFIKVNSKGSVQTSKLIVE